MTALGIQGSSWRLQRIVPVVTVDTVSQAIAVGRRLFECGFAIIEVTLRTPIALEAISSFADEVPDLVVGAGSVRSPSDLEAALKAGARFLVSPGHTAELLAAGRAAPVPYIPGGVTASELLNIREAGFLVAKFFPAEAMGGAKALAAFAGPLADMAFVPTGGIGPENLRSYLSLPSVLAIGSSSMVPKEKIEARDLQEIGLLCKAMRSAAEPNAEFAVIPE